MKAYAALGQLPYTGVKIDMSLVQALEGAGSEKAQAQVRSLCEMAKALGADAVFSKPFALNDLVTRIEELLRIEH